MNEQMQEWLEKLQELSLKKRDVMLVIVASRQGSTPGALGAKMLVAEKGRVFGTIGGGALEYRCESRAMELLVQHRCGVEHFELVPQGEGELGMICGGAAVIWFHFVGKGTLFSKTEKSPRYLVLEQDVTGKGTASLCQNPPIEEERSRYEQEFIRFPEGGACYWEPLHPQNHVYLFGAGHVARALCPGLCKVGFCCHVFDDREEYARPEYFVGAVEVRQADLEQLGELCDRITQEDFVCVMTHGHKKDHAVIRQILKTPAGYLGVIGSVRKREATRALLREEGFSETDLDRLVTPIGLSIGAESPEEIAVSILAQLIERRAQMRKHR